MSSIIPKQKVGVLGQKNKFDLSCMTHTTSEIGYVQPTFSKVLVPNTTLTIGTRTGSRLSPLFVPTMGEIDIRHYHCYVPFNTLWFPFDAFKTGTNYTLPDGTTYQPQFIPWTSVSKIFKLIFDNMDDDNPASNFAYNFRQYITASIYVSATGRMFGDADYTLLNSHRADLEFILNDPNPVVKSKYYLSEEGNIWRLDHIGSNYQFTRVLESQIPNHLSFPTKQSCDFCTVTSESYHPESSIPVGPDGSTYFTTCFNFNGPWKRLRSIFMGLGYSFNPFDDQKVHLLKLLAFYKAYWQLFGVNRTYNFYNTYCYKLIKCLSDRAFYSELALNSEYIKPLILFFLSTELAECTYTTPPDYFSASDINTQRSASQTTGGYNFNSLIGSQGFSSNVGAKASSDTRSTVAFSGNSSLNVSAFAIAQKAAQKLYRFVNKYSVVGRKVSDLLRATYGVADKHNDDHEGVYFIGACSTPIQISPVFNQSDSGDMPLGSYAGLGVGTGSSKKFFLDTQDEVFGVFITMTAVVPKMGYFQGLARENSDGCTDRSEIWQPEFDALGSQAVRYNELVADRQFSPQNRGTSLGVFGYMPSFSHLKITTNRCLGDISLPHMIDSMLPYTLDRYFSPRGGYVPDSGTAPDPDRQCVIYGNSLPVNDPMWFRAGTRGQTNRIFSDMSPTDDHIIMQIFFDISMVAPMKSLATSFDTIDEEASHTLEYDHE